jgi:hypothetical protein
VKIVKLLLITTILFGLSSVSFGQDEDSLFNAMLTTRVKVENPVYKPTIGFGYGVMNFYGEVHNNLRSPVSGPAGYKLNIATFLDKKHFFKTNFFILSGTLTGNERSVTDTARNWNFKSDIFSIGINFHYDFGHFIKFTDKNFIRPFVSIGIENVQFNSKTDLYYNKAGDLTNYPYYYWTDGTIRNVPQGSSLPSQIINRDYKYETDLRDLNRNGLGSYSQNTFAIPVEYGLDFRITDRINLRIVDSWHYTFTDNIDDVSPAGTRRKGNKWNDMFRYSYISLHLDLFSDAKEIILKKLAADVNNFDYAMFDDEDNDGVRDLIDKCPGTPAGVAVDSVGCPLDGDKDGVPDYLDKEPNTPPGALVDENGVQIKPEDYAKRLDVEAIPRKEVEAYLTMRKAQSRVKGRPSMPIPAKFKSVDTDGDGYISFDELVKAINDFFDSSSTLTAKDIYELQDFFFEQ